MEVLQRTANRGSISTGYDIANSLKFEADNSEYLNRTSGANGSRTTWTTSVWVKRTELGVNQVVFSSVNSSSQANFYRFLDSDKIRFYFQPDDVAVTYYADTNAVFRDTSAWYHIVWGLDSTNSDGSKRFVVYVNGVYQDSTWGGSSTASINCPQNSGSRFLQSEPIQIGRGTYGADHYFSGYMAELHVLDGIAPDPTDFGEFDEDSGIWKPKAYTGSHGTQGFYLDFEDAANLGDDVSGNGNNFTPNNITSIDQATDTPTNNGCTLNVLASLEGSNDITEGALVSTGASGSFNGTYGTMGIDPFNSSVDWYWEIEASSTTNGSSDDIGIGWIKESRITSGSTAFNNVYADGISRYSSQTATSAGDIWGVLLETGATPVFKLYRNDSLIHTSTHGSGGVSFDTLMFPYITVKGTGTDARLNFLNPASSFSIASGNTDPNGYGNFEFDTKGGYALCGKNLAEYGGTA